MKLGLGVACIAAKQRNLGLEGEGRGEESLGVLVHDGGKGPELRARVFCRHKS